MKNLLLYTLAFGLLCNLALSQSSSITIPAGARIYIPNGGQICADTIYVYGELKCDNLSGVCSTCKVECHGICDPPELSGDKPMIAGPDSIDFGDVQIGKFKQRTFAITNTGSEPLIISSTDITPGIFVIDIGGGAQTLQPAEFVMVTLNFGPTVSGAATGTFTVTSNAANFSTLIVALYGNGTEGDPVAEVDPTSLDFGSVDAGSTKTENVTIKNIGQGTLRIMTEDISGTDAGLFSITQSAAGAFNNGQFATLTIEFAPSSSGTKSAKYTCTTNDPAMGTITIDLTGEGVDQQPIISVTPDPVNFGQATVGTQVDKSVTIRNTGSASLTLTAQTVSGAMFSIASAGNTSIAPGNSTTATVRFQPTSAGAKTGTFTVQSNDPTNPSVSVQLQGIGTSQQLCLSVSPLSLALGETAPGTPVTKDLTITNSCATSISATLTITGNGFTVASTTPVTINGNDNVTAEIKFDPQIEGQFSATLTVATSNPTQSIDVSLSGLCRKPAEGGRITVDRTIVNFGQIIVNVPSEKDLEVSNIGNGDLFVADQVITTGDSLIFTIVNRANSPLASGSSSTMRLRAFSQVEGNYNSILRLVTNDIGLPRFDVTLIAQVVLDVEPIQGIPTGIALHQNYPNPFNPSTEIEYELDRTATVRLDVFSTYGELVATLVDDQQMAGIYKAKFNANGVPSGVYAAVLRVTDAETKHVRTIMMTLMK